MNDSRKKQNICMKKATLGIVQIDELHLVHCEYRFIILL